jgi:hypothetical protein
MPGSIRSVCVAPSFFRLDEITVDARDTIHVGFWSNHIAIEGDAGYGTIDGGELSQEPSVND